MTGRLNLMLPVASLRHLSLAKLGLSFLSSSLSSGAVTFETDGSDLSKEKLPEYYMPYLKDVVYEIVSDFQNWCEIMKLDEIMLPIESFHYFRFTSRGLVKVVETCANIINDEKFDVIHRYRLACEYYLEESVRALWERMKPEDLHHFDVATIKDLEPHSVTLWSLRLLEMEGEILTFLENPDDLQLNLNALAFKKELLRGDEYGAKYFFDKITKADRNTVLTLVREDIDREKYMLYVSFLSRPQLEIEFQNNGVSSLFTCETHSGSDYELYPRFFEEVLSFLDEENYFEILLYVVGVRIYPSSKVTFFEYCWTHELVPQSYRDYVLRKPGEDGIVRLLVEICQRRCSKWEFHIIMRCVREEHRKIIVAGLVDLFNQLKQDLLPIIDFEWFDFEIRSYKMLIRKIVTSKVELECIRKSCSDILEQDEALSLFFEDTKRFFGDVDADRNVLCNIV